MIRQARTSDALLVKSREITGRTQTMPWWLGEEGVKTTENRIHWPHCSRQFCFSLVRALKETSTPRWTSLSFPTQFLDVHHFTFNKHIKTYHIYQPHSQNDDFHSEIAGDISQLPFRSANVFAKCIYGKANLETVFFLLCNYFVKALNNYPMLEFLNNLWGLGTK